MQETINSINNIIRGSYNYNISGNNNYKRLVFVVIFINVSLIFRAEAFIKYPDKNVIINNNSTLKVLEFIKSVLKFIIIFI